MFKKSLPDPTKGSYGSPETSGNSSRTLYRKSLPNPPPNGYAPSIAPSTAATELPGYSNAPMTPQFRTRFASMSMHMRDRLRFVRFPPETFDSIHTAIISTWPKGIQDIRTYAGSHEIKFRGNPWSGTGQDAMHARRAMCRILAALHGLGWVMTLSTDVSRKPDDKDTLIFRYQDPRPAECEWMSVAFSMQDRLRFIDAPVELYSQVVRRLGSAVQKHEPYSVPGTYEIKFFGTPWRASGEATMGTRELLLSLLEELEAEGWTVYASIDQKAIVSDSVSETDTWHCCRPVGWVRGAPVYHA